MSKVTITTQPYFSGSIRILGYLLPFIGIGVVVVNMILGIVFLLVGILILTTNYKLTIDVSSKEIFDHIWVLGITKGDKYRFQKLEKVFVNANNYSQQLHMKSIGNNIKFVEYHAYLKADDKKFFLGDSKNRETISNKARSLSSQLNLPFQEVDLE